MQARIAAARTPAGWGEQLPRRLTFDATGAPQVRLDSKNLPALFFNSAFDIVEAEGKQIAKCERHNCDNLLVREGRTVYCSARCSQTARTMKHRHKKALEANEVENV